VVRAGTAVPPQSEMSFDPGRDARTPQSEMSFDPGRDARASTTRENFDPGGDARASTEAGNAINPVEFVANGGGTSFGVEFSS
jgi:hypothetical protein